MATFIAGPCVIESMELLDTVAQELVRINQKLGTDIIFSASSAPTPAVGRVERIVIGWIKLSYSTPSTIYIATTAATTSQTVLPSADWKASELAPGEGGIHFLAVAQRGKDGAVRAGMNRLHKADVRQHRLLMRG